MFWKHTGYLCEKQIFSDFYVYINHCSVSQRTFFRSDAASWTAEIECTVSSLQVPELHHLYSLLLLGPVLRESDCFLSFISLYLLSKLCFLISPNLLATMSLVYLLMIALFLTSCNVICDNRDNLEDLKVLSVIKKKNP